MSSHRSVTAPLLFASSAAVALAIPGLAHAHPSIDHALGFTSGFFHPWGGLDHVTAMVAVGLWAGQQGGSARWWIPASFVGVMALGGAIGMLGLPLIGVETVILVSMLAIGSLVATAVRMPLVLGALLVGGFALFHGHAHGTELASTASASSQALGFSCATALLHGIGVAMATAVERIGQPMVLRASGAAIALCGACLLGAAL